MNKFLIKPEIYFGAHSLHYLKRMDASQVFIVTDKVMVQIGMLGKVTQLLNEHDVPYTVFSEVEPDPSLETIQKGLLDMMETKPDTLIAIGGGSPIDAAKAMLYFYMRTEEKKTGQARTKKPLFIAVPTTSGTGSEVTSYSVVTDKKAQVKIPLSEDMMLPDIAILDEELTKTVPPAVTADTGIDVLTHAIEAYVSVKATEFTDIYAEKAIKDVFHYLGRAFDDGQDTEARRKMHVASCMAGIAFTNASLGINHSMAHTLGARFKLPHGRSNAVLLPYVIGYNAGMFDGTVQQSETAKKYAAIAHLLGFPAADTEMAVACLIRAIQMINQKLGIPATIKECGVIDSLFEENAPLMAENAFDDQCTGGNPKTISKQELLNLFKRAYYGS